VPIVKEVYLCTCINQKFKKMKKNLQNALLLAMGLMTTVTFAQDWNVDSRTRVNMHGENDMMLTEQRATIGATWGGTDWGIHVSSDVNYLLGDGSNGQISMMVYEAYASTDLMGYANMSAGRMALDYGSGAIVGSNQFGTRNTRDGLLFAIENDMLDLDFGLATGNLGTDPENSSRDILLNASKAEGDWSANFLYVKGSSVTAGEADEDRTAMGIDLSYALMGGALELNGSSNTYTEGDIDMDMMSYGASYNVNDDLSISATQTTYGDGGFNMSGANMGNDYIDDDGNVHLSWLENGNMGFLDAGDVDLAFGASYSMGDFNVGATMHKVTNDGDDVVDGWERNATEMSLGYTMSDNASLGLKMVKDNYGTEDDLDFMWLTLTITP